MNAPTIDHIIELIDRLPSADRLALEERLAERAESEWQREAAQAQRQACERGIDQESIDQAVAAHRYGK